MNITKLLSRQKKASKASIWIEFDGSRIHIAPINTPKHRQAISDASRKAGHRKVYKDAEIQTKVAIEAMVESVVLGWENVMQQDPDSKPEDGEKLVPLPFTKENVRKILEIDEVREYIAEQALDLENFLQEEKAADEAALKRDSTLGAE